MMPEIQIERYSPFLDRLASLFETMDRKYDEAADHYDFHCAGCEDNCCYTRFFHHTRLEYFYIRKGFSTLPPATQTDVLNKAAAYCEKMKEEDARPPCPLNSEGLCLLYAYRPMICRLHGISHELRIPGRNPVRSPGCKAFMKQSLDKSYFVFDRTPFYIEMSGLENELKTEMGTDLKLKMTVAEMLSPEPNAIPSS